jgi:hypothetical protein
MLKSCILVSSAAPRLLQYFVLWLHNLKYHYTLSLARTIQFTLSHSIYLRLISISFFLLYLYFTFFSLALQSQFGPWPTSMKLSVSLGLLLVDLRQSVGLLGRVIGLSQGPYMYRNIEKRSRAHAHTHTQNTKHPCPEWDSNP